MIYSVQDLALMYERLRLEKKYGVNSRSSIKINNPDALVNLCHLDYAIFGKTNALVEAARVNLVGVIINDRFFNVDLNEVIEKPRRHR